MQEKNKNMVEKKYYVPIWEKYALTVEEASVYFGIGVRKIRQIVLDDPNADFKIQNGTKILIKRRKFEEYLDKVRTI